MKYSKIIIGALVATGAASTAAQAQSSTAQAETLFRQGKDLIAQGKIAEACGAFDASQKLDPTIATLLNQASCREKNGQLATAWGLFLDAERQTRAAIDEAGRQFHQVATNHAAKLEPRLSTLTITVPAEAQVGGLEILRNTDPVDPGAWNKALPVDGGTYKITARAPGNTDWSTTITVGVERDAKTVETPKLKAAELQSSHPSAAASPAHANSPPASHQRSKVLTLVLGGAALALGGTAIGFELWSGSAYDKSKKEVDNNKQRSLYNSANTRRYVAESFGIAGIACAGAAVWFYLRSNGQEAPASGAQRSPGAGVHAQRSIVVPVVSNDRVGLVLQGSY